MEKNQSEVPTVFELTLEEAMGVMQSHLDEMDLNLSLGVMWTRKKWDVSYRDAVMLGWASSCREQATGALSRLRYWTAQNVYATTLTVSQLLMSWSAGSATLMDLIRACFLMVWAWEDFESRHEDIAADIAKMYHLD